MDDKKGVQVIGTCALCGRVLTDMSDFHYDEAHNVLICHEGYKKSICK